GGRARGGRAQPLATLPGGQAARVALAAILLSRFDVLLLDEPTNDLDFDGLERLEAFLASSRAAAAIVSHDRDFLDRTVSRVVELDEGSRAAREYPGGWSEDPAPCDRARAAQSRRFGVAAQ